MRPWAFPHRWTWPEELCGFSWRPVQARKSGARQVSSSRYDYFGGIEYGMFDGSHRFECGRWREDDRLL